ncbi:MAG: hypothetical protein HRT45_12195 [Bdellovibrionales bacterium]|nr:hypothetical protein [Bdellovibrionales bacterium]
MLILAAVALGTFLISMQAYFHPYLLNEVFYFGVVPHLLIYLAILGIGYAVYLRVPFLNRSLSARYTKPYSEPKAVIMSEALIFLVFFPLLLTSPIANGLNQLADFSEPKRISVNLLSHQITTKSILQTRPCLVKFEAKASDINLVGSDLRLRPNKTECVDLGRHDSIELVVKAGLFGSSWLQAIRKPKP